MSEITDFTLLKNKYDIATLELNVENLDKKILLATQKLNAEFCIKYIWDPEIDNGSEASYIFDFQYILIFQKHLTEYDLLREVKNIYN
tara:strand:+ start:1288 stop:1551 length:264 start_codon:yes stop_codon:yes gene_type:complete